MSVEKNLMTGKRLQCNEGVCNPVETIFEKIKVDIKTKPSTKIMLAVLIPTLLLLFGSVGGLALFQMRNQQDMFERIYTKVSEINTNVQVFAVQLKSVKELGDQDSLRNRDRIERLELWKDKETRK